MGEIISSIPGIAGVLITPLKQFEDQRGKVMHMMTESSPRFRRFGEVYFSQVNPSVVKAWKRHKEMTQNFAVPVGEIKLVIFDGREGSPSKGIVQVIAMGAEKYGLVTIPPGVWYGFQGVSAVPAIIANLTDIPHSPDESEKLDQPHKDIPYTF